MEIDKLLGVLKKNILSLGPLGKEVSKEIKGSEDVKKHKAINSTCK